MSERPNFDLNIDALFEEMDRAERERKIENILEKTNIETEAAKNVSTVQKVEFWVRKIEAEGSQLGLGDKILDMDPRSLNAVLCSFISSSKRNDGEDYEISSIHNMFSLLGKYLRENRYPKDIETDDEFRSAREAKSTKVKKLKAAGKGNRPNRAMPISLEDEEMMWKKGGFGMTNPLCLIRTVWYLLTLSFGLRGRHEARQLEWGDVWLKKDSDGTEYLEMTERLTKTRDGQASSGSRAFSPKAFAAENKERCPVEHYKEYARRRPSCACQLDSPFFLAINHKRKENSDIWFMNSPLGKNLLGTLMKSGCEAAGVKGSVTNHSVRKTAVKRALDSGCPAEYTAQLTGHKNVSSLKGYAEACMDVQRKMSRSVLTGATFNISNNISSSKTKSDENSGTATAPVQFVFHGCSGITINTQK